MDEDRISGHLDRGFERIDARMVAIDERMLAIDERMRVIQERFDRSEERYAALFADFREFMRTMMVRFERAMDRHDKALDDLTAQINDDNRFETRAQTQAVLRLLDRFGPGDAPAAA